MWTPLVTLDLLVMLLLWTYRFATRSRVRTVED